MSIVVEAAAYATVQDLGRPGLASQGIVANGAADQHAARVASILVGNRESAPLIEITGSSFVATASGGLLIAVTGAAEHVLVDGHAHPAWNPVVVRAGQRVAIELPARGWRSYLAVAGHLAADTVLGSVAPDALLGLGRRLTAGDEVAIDGPPPPGQQEFPFFRFGVRPPSRPRPLVVDVTPGPERAEFDDALTGRAFVVGERSDHVGLRLEGDAPARGVATEILSRGVPVGAVETPPNGGLLVLLRGRLLTAGYPVSAVATSYAIDELAQCRPGDAVRFREVTTAHAVSTLEAQRDERALLAERVERAFGGVSRGR